MVVSWFFLNIQIGTHVSPLDFYVVRDAQISHEAIVVNACLC